LHDVLANYQASIKSLLLIQDFSGVTLEELELFKREFRTSAYTCRFPLCPRATAGFDTNELRLEHEATHTQRLRCLYPGCQYPPFMSARALKNHEIKCHETVQGRKRIRRVAAWPQHHLQGSLQAERGGEELSEAHPILDSDSTGASSHQGIRGVPAQIQPPHAHPQTNDIVTKEMNAQRPFHQIVSQAQESSLIVRNGTPVSHSHSSPTVNNIGNVPIQQSASSIGGSPPRLGSVVQKNHHPIGAPIAQGVAAQRSQQSHAGTPGMPNSTPSIQSTPLMMSQAVPNPPNDQKRVKVYELRNNSWFDRGTGFCTAAFIFVRVSSACPTRLLSIVPMSSSGWV
jgi:hypothetical protein